jgi:uncharacterized repeat protein (TIGR01451 family)
MTLKLRLVVFGALLALSMAWLLALDPRGAVAQAPGDLAVTKSTVTTTTPGATLTYTVTISNVGAGPRELINFTDILPTNTTYVAGSFMQTSGPAFVLATNGPPVTQLTASRVLFLNGGESATFTFQVVVSAAATNGTTIVNSCIVASTSTAFNETNLTNNTCVFTTVVVVAPTATPVPSVTPVPTATPVPFVQPVIPQVFQHPVGGIFNGTRNNTPTPVRPAAVAPMAPGAMPVLRPPSTGEAGMVDRASSNVLYGLAIIGVLGLVTLTATRVRASRKR